MLNTTFPSMPTRGQLLSEFIDRCGHNQMQRLPVAADASFRRYERLQGNNRSLIVMDAPPPQEDMRPFMQVTALLRAMTFSAPEIYESDVEQGFLLLEDLGHMSFSSLLKQTPAMEEMLYLEATELLVQLNQRCQHVPNALPAYNREVQLREVALLSDWFMPQVVGTEQAHGLRESWLEAWQQVLDAVPPREKVPVLRDYHADNLMWLADRTGVERVGLLDYQDALLGDPAYDLVSFLEDIRRDVSPQVIDACKRHFVAGCHEHDADFAARYAVLGAQRNSKIVGIFTRLCVRDGKRHYLNFLPKVWRWLEHDVSHPALAPVRGWLDTHVPAAARGVIDADPKIGEVA